mgnify:CR=1 FL=1
MTPARAAYILGRLDDARAEIVRLRAPLYAGVPVYWPVQDALVHVDAADTIVFGHGDFLPAGMAPAPGCLDAAQVVTAQDVRLRDSVVQAHAEVLTARQPVLQADVERQLLLLNDMPGVVARGVFTPGAAPGARRNALLSVPIRRASSASDRKVGEPPPKCSCDTDWPAPSRSTCNAISFSSTSRYSPARSWCLVMTLLQAQ